MMRVFKKPALLGGLLVLLGGLLLLNMFGIHVGWIARVILSGFVIAGGWKLYRMNGSFRKLVGAGLMLLGLLTLIGLLHVLLAVAAAVILLYVGWKMIKRNRNTAAGVSYSDSQQTFKSSPHGSVKDDLDKWEARLRKAMEKP
jgi:lia operon protein LiaI